MLPIARQRVMGDMAMRFFTSIAPTLAGVNIFKVAININCVFKLVSVKIGLFAGIKSDAGQFDAGMIAGADSAAPGIG